MENHQEEHHEPTSHIDRDEAEVPLHDTSGEDALHMKEVHVDAPVLRTKKVNSDDEAWRRLFDSLTGGGNEKSQGVPAVRSRVNLHVDDCLDSSENRPGKEKRSSSIFDKLTPNGSAKGLKLSPSFSKKKTPLLDREERSIKIECLEEYIYDKKSVELEIEYGIPRSHLTKLLVKLKKEDTNQNGKIEFEEWMQFYHKYYKEADSMQSVLEWFIYKPSYSLMPPPVVILFFSVIQVIMYVWHTVHVSSLLDDDILTWQSPVCSYLIYHPTKRYQVWRFVTYQFVHVNLEHIVFNTLMQVVVGLPLEMSQEGWEGTFRVFLVYLSGVALGSLGGSLTSPTSYLAGASAGVYALIAAHLATLVLNWKEDGDVFKERRGKNKHVSQSLNPLIRSTKAVFVVTFTLFDVGYSLYNHYSGVVTNTGSGWNQSGRIAKKNRYSRYMGHFSGALAGLLVGLVALDNRKVEEWEVKLKMASVTIYVFILLATVFWHLIGTETGYFPDSTYGDCYYSVISSLTNSSVDHSHL